MQRSHRSSLKPSFSNILECNLCQNNTAQTASCNEVFSIMHGTFFVLSCSTYYLKEGFNKCGALICLSKNCTWKILIKHVHMWNCRCMCFEFFAILEMSFLPKKRIAFNKLITILTIVKTKVELSNMHTFRGFEWLSSTIMCSQRKIKAILVNNRLIDKSDALQS